MNQKLSEVAKWENGVGEMGMKINGTRMETHWNFMYNKQNSYRLQVTENGKGKAQTYEQHKNVSSYENRTTLKISITSSHHCKIVKENEMHINDEN